MEPMTIDRQKLIAYLLDRLPEAEREAIAEQYFTDNELFEHMQEVESDLIGQYVRGRLAAEDRPRLESYLQVLPDGGRKVAVARALASVSPAERAAAEAALFETTTPVAVMEQLSNQTTGLWQRFVARLAHPVPALAMATGLIAFGGAMVLMYQRNERLSHGNEQLLAQMRERDALHEQSSREAEGRLAETRAEAAQLRQELEHERQLRESSPPVPSPGVALPLISWPLSSTGLRAPGQPSETVRLDPKAKTIALTIPTRGGQKYAGYEVELKTEDGRQILWKDNQPNSPPMRSGQNLIFHRPAREFAEASYKLTLTLFSGGERKTRDYYFTVVKP